MSTLVEYNRKVYYWEDELGSKEYILLVRQGDSNVIDPDTNRIAKEWSLIAFGAEYQLWIEIGKRAGYTMGGMIQVGDGRNYRWIDIVDYIEKYRKAIKNAKPISEMFKDFKNIEFVIQFNKHPDTMPTPDTGNPNTKYDTTFFKEKFDALREKYGVRVEEKTDYYGYRRYEVRMPIKSVDEFNDTVLLWRLSNSMPDVRAFYCFS